MTARNITPSQMPHWLLKLVYCSHSFKVARPCNKGNAWRKLQYCKKIMSMLLSVKFKEIFAIYYNLATLSKNIYNILGHWSFLPMEFRRIKEKYVPVFLSLCLFIIKTIHSKNRLRPGQFCKGLRFCVLQLSIICLFRIIDIIFILVIIRNLKNSTYRKCRLTRNPTTKIIIKIATSEIKNLMWNTMSLKENQQPSFNTWTVQVLFNSITGCASYTI